MALTLVSPPAAEPVSVELARLQCRRGAELDGLLEVYIPAARELGEHITNRAFITQDWRLDLDRWPDDIDVKLWRPPHQQVLSVEYVDPDGNLQTLASTAYVLKAKPLPGWLLPAVNTTWPSIAAVADAVRITLRTGYGDAASDVPAGIRLWMLQRIAAAVENPAALDVGGRVAMLPDRFVDSALDPFIVPAVT